ncbi:MAG: IS66 family insertion sequence element accessory protein TnpB [Treponema sp.]|nr:IS66 family insertion sequence element accessory protein TnpB [Treponema sp.]
MQKGGGKQFVELKGAGTACGSGEIIIEKGEPFSGNVYVFCNRERKLLKALWWDRNGFWLSRKRLEKDRFPWPEDREEARELSGVAPKLFRMPAPIISDVGNYRNPLSSLKFAIGLPSGLSSRFRMSTPRLNGVSPSAFR